MREDFLKFMPVVDVTFNGLAEFLIDSLKNIGLDFLVEIFYVGKARYDGACAMSSHFNGLQVVVRWSYPLSIIL